jgi:hypothetical protein
MQAFACWRVWHVNSADAALLFLAVHARLDVLQGIVAPERLSDVYIVILMTKFCLRDTLNVCLTS